MSRLTNLLRQARKADAQLGADLEAEFRALTSRRTFGLVFERHVPEEVELPQRPVRKGDKVHVLPPRGGSARGDQRLWSVVRFDNGKGSRKAHLVELGTNAPETRAEPVEDLVVVAEFRDPIYPGLIETGRVERGDDKPFHTVINGENYHALELLTYTHRGMVDAIYIDPPYNSGAKDWTYNNRYVESDDHYRHSKWLAFMERRLKLARELLNPEGSVLIVTIDEKEYLRLGLLLEQVFTEGRIQMVSSVINPKGVVRFNELTRTNEFIYFVAIGEVDYTPEFSGGSEAVRWASLRRFEKSSRRHGPQPRPDQFYPIYIGQSSGLIEHVGKSLPLDVSRETVEDIEGCDTVWPLKPGGTEMIWGLTPATLKRRLQAGYVRVSKGRGGYALYYLTSGQIGDIEGGALVVTGKDDAGAVIVEAPEGKSSLPTTQWNRESHNAQSNGTGMLSALLPERPFPYPKSLYAVADCLRLVVGTKPDAIIVDFFAGSGTTAHAVMRLNRQDGGRRQCILVTNNEVAAGDQAALRTQGLRPGDSEWEQWGICDHITKPRIEAAITGQTPNGEAVVGDYKFVDEFPMSEGLEENAVSFTLTYEGPLPVAHHRAFGRIAQILWLRAGARGEIITTIGEEGWAIAENYGVLDDLDAASGFVRAMSESETATIAYIVTDDDLVYQMVCRDLPSRVSPIQLYESYLHNFELNSGRLG